MKKLICFVCISATILICNNIETQQKINTVNTVSKCIRPIIIVDAGHGGFDGGAVKGDVLEKDINLNFALSLEQFLKAYGFSVVMTRISDDGTQDSGLNTIREKKVSDIKNRLNSWTGNTVCSFILVFVLFIPVIPIGTAGICHQRRLIRHSLIVSSG